MKKLSLKWIVLSVLIIFTFGNAATQQSTTMFRGNQVVKNSIVVVTEKAGLAKSTTNSMKILASQIATEVKPVIPQRGIEEWIVSGDMETALKHLNAIPGVKAFPNRVYELEPTGKIIKSEDGVPADPFFPYQWALHNTGAVEDSMESLFGFSELESSVAGADIDMIRAWQAMEDQTVNTVLVVVFDSGIDYEHPDLQGKIWTNPGEIPNNGIDDDDNGFVDDYYGYDVANDDSDPMDVHGHGTGVAGIIGATIDTIGMSGIAPNVKMIAVKASEDGYFYTIDILHGLYYVSVLQKQLIDAGSSVRIVAVNHSWGGTGILDEYNLREAEVTVNYALEQAEMGIAWFCSAGNDFVDLDEQLLYRYPSTLPVPNIISIGATDYMDDIVNIWWGSSHGMASVDLGAPGLQVLSTAPGGYQEFGGTSAATPHAVGVYAIAKGLYPNESYNDIFIRLMAGADRKTGYNGYWMTEGRLNALNSIRPDSLESAVKFNVDKLYLLCCPEDGQAVGNVGFINGTSSAVSVSTVTLTYTDGATESRALDLSGKGLSVESNGAFGVAVNIPVAEIIAGGNGYSRSGTIEFAGIGSVPFEVRLKQYPSITVNPEYTVLPKVAWGETVNSAFTIGNSGDADLEFVISPIVDYYNRDLEFFLLPQDNAPVNITESSKKPRDFEKIIELDYQTLSEALQNSERSIFTLNATESSDPFTILWNDSLNDAAQVAQDWEIIEYGSGDNWRLYDVDTSTAIDNVFLAGDFTNGYQNNTLTVAASPYFNFRSIIESTKKIPVFLQFDYATELEEYCDYFYINLISESGKIATIAQTDWNLSSNTDSATTVMVDLTSYLTDLVLADSVTFWFITNTDNSNSVGFGTVFDNVSLWLGESPLVYEDASGNGILDGSVLPGQDLTVSITLNTAGFPEGEIGVLSLIRNNDPRSYYAYSILVVETEYGHITVNPEYCFADSLYRGETMKSSYSITNDGLVDIQYLTIPIIQYQSPEPIQIIGANKLLVQTPSKPNTGIDYRTRSTRFHSRLSQTSRQPVLQSFDKKAESAIFKMDNLATVPEPFSWMETFDESLELPTGWTTEDYTYGFGTNWKIDSLQNISGTATNVALFGDLQTLEYYDNSECALFSPWISIPDNDTMRTLMEFDYSTMLELYYDWFDVYVVWREPGDETGDTWRDRPIATNDPDWSSVPLLVSDNELHTFSTRLPVRVSGKEIMLVFVIYTDESVNEGYALFDNVMLYQQPRNFYITDRSGKLAKNETVTIEMAAKNTKILRPGYYSVYSLILYYYQYDSLYNEKFDEYANIFLGMNLTEFKILNHEPVVQADTLFTVSGEVIGLKKILKSIILNDSDIDDSLKVVGFGDPVYGEFKDLLGLGEMMDNMLGYAYVAPLLPETRDLLKDQFVYWSTDRWSLVGAPVTVNVLQRPQFIRSAQHVFPINEDESLTIDLMRLAAGLSTDGVQLEWKSESTVGLTRITESSLITITPIADFFGTTSAKLYLKKNSFAIDSTLVQFVVSSVNDMPTAGMSVSINANQISCTDESNDNRDKDGGIVAWHWDFGDNLTSDEQNPVHTYADSGHYQITLTVTDNAGAQASIEETIHIAVIVGLADGTLAVPEEFRMFHNYPNPFNPTTTIRFAIPKSSRVTLSIYDLNGRIIERLVDEQKEPGYYSVQWNASRYSSGMYFYKIQAGNFQEVKKCLLIK